MNISLNHNASASNAARNLAAHYTGLSTSVRRLSTGLRVQTAADDAAGLAIRELMRADITALNQGVRNASDAVSLIQTADGALQIIDEKLIRMKELAEQAATGTYNSDQRLMIDSEFQAMAREIQRIATATDFNGIKLLDGSLSGAHDGSGLTSQGMLKTHFGSGNDSAEDYYYITIGDATLQGLGLGESSGGGGGGSGGSGSSSVPGVENVHNVPVLGGKVQNHPWLPLPFASGLVSFAVIPKGTKNITLNLIDNGRNDSLQLFSVSGKHLIGTTLGGTDWDPERDGTGIVTAGDADSTVLTAVNGFIDGATYDGSSLNGTGGDLLRPSMSDPYRTVNIDGMTIIYSGEANAGGSGGNGASWENTELIRIDEATEDLVVVVPGAGSFLFWANWDEMPPTAAADYNGGSGGSSAISAISIQTQELAQQALERVDNAIVEKDKIRAHLGATQNRLENTITNLQNQAENLQAAESRISDVDVSLEMGAYVHRQVLAQTATAMLAQANSLPSVIAELLK